MSAYEELIQDNLDRFYTRSTDPDPSRQGSWHGGSLAFRAFGEDCLVQPNGITLAGRPEVGPKGVVISLYTLHAVSEPLRLQPFRAFRDLPGSMPYGGAYHANTEMVLVPYVATIRAHEGVIRKVLQGEDPGDGMGGDFSFVLYPFPKIALCYLFYLPDDDFPASVTCLFSANALSFMPLDGLADTAEYTSRRLIELVR